MSDRPAWRCPLFSFTLSVFLVACSGSAPIDDTGSSGDTAQDTAQDTDTDKNASLTGVLTWTDGSAAEGLQVRLCYSSCYTTGSDEDGVFGFSGVEAATYTLPAVVPGDETYATPTAPVTLESHVERELDPWVVPVFATGETVEQVEEVELDGGLVLTADPEGVSRGTYSPSEEPFVASVWVDPQDSGVPLEGIEGTVVGVWYLGNYDLQLDPSWPLGGTLGLDEGTELQVRTASNSDKAWIDEGVLTVGADGSLAQTGGEGISQLTTLLLVLKEEAP